ncbi:hypothetical protein HGG75_24640 [Ochrobactrum pseudogrignonense]|nr:hypothetical protein [Brucella pseudogrignonensis]
MTTMRPVMALHCVRGGPAIRDPFRGSAIARTTRISYLVADDCSGHYWIFACFMGVAMNGNVAKQRKVAGTAPQLFRYVPRRCCCCLPF